LTPCPVHTGRPKNQPWSGNREPWERAQRAKLRAQKITEVGERCERCGAQGDGVELQLHHVRPISPTSTTADVQLLCRPCHRELDHWAR
jgi:5-methylcytosine-specific restriction endonuclease McrA